MIELWIRPTGLRKGHNPNGPQLTDIGAPPKLMDLADCIVLETEIAAFVRKGANLRSKGRILTRVEFDPSRLDQHKLSIVLDTGDLVKIAEMRKTLQNDYLSGDVDAADDGRVYDGDGAGGS